MPVFWGRISFNPAVQYEIVLFTCTMHVESKLKLLCAAIFACRVLAGSPPRQELKHLNLCEGDPYFPTVFASFVGAERDDTESTCVSGKK